MSVYSKGKIAIPEVTGDLVITIGAVLQQPNLFPSQFFDTDGTTLYDGKGYKAGLKINSVGTEAAIAATSCLSGYLAVSPGQTLTVSGASKTPSSTYYSVTYYDSNHQIIKNESWTATSYKYPPVYQIADTFPANGSWVIPTGVAYVRICTDTVTADPATRTLTVHLE